jgi:hypothetical protein
MTSSVLLGLTDNTNLIFDQPGVVTGYDPDTGNPITDTVQVVIRATLKNNNNPPRDAERSQPGNRPAQWMVGKCVDPALWPPEIPFDAVCKCEIDLPTGGKSIGTFHPYQKMPSGALTRLGLTDIAGQKIQGWFSAGNMAVP